ncbi:MAG TPA: helix-turn-helix domain-containing protein [Solirubrobacteraceae bacterium]|nr:helix-turn-helix domain-containing protein [Solirubrobacteraceae bacterium]
MKAGPIAEPTNARSRRTRAALLAAARTILEHDGFEALTMTAVAERVGVTRRSVYLHFPTRAALVGALFDFNAESEGLHESLRRVWDAPDAVSALDGWAAHLAEYHIRLMAVDRAIERVRHDDDDAAAVRRRVVAEKLQNARRLARRLEHEGRLKKPWTAATATDMLYALISSDMIEALTVDRRWSRRRLAEHLSQLFRATFVGPPEPSC